MYLHSLKYRIALVIFLLEAVMMSSLLSLTYESSTKKTEKLIQQSESAVLNFVSDISRLALLTNEFEDLQSHLMGIAMNPHVLDVIVADSNGTILVSTNYDFLGLPVTDVTQQKGSHWQSRKIANAANHLGDIRINFSQTDQQAINVEARNLGIKAATIGMTIIAFIGLLSGYLLTRRLSSISAAAALVEQGNFDINMTLKGKDEVAVLSRRFQTMVNALGQNINELSKSKQDLENRVSARTIELEKTRDQALALSQAKTELLSRMSHELRTPLNAVIGFSELLMYDQDSQTSEDRNESITYIKEAGNHLLDMVNEILDFNAIDAGNFNLSMEVFLLSDIIGLCGQLMTPIFTQKNIDFSMNIEEITDVPVLADKVRLKQIIINLMSNAAKYNIEGGSIKLDYSITNLDTVVVRITDTGFGIPAEKFDKVFLAFERLHIEKQISGTGIGLALCKRIVESMNGSIGFESVEGKGSTFWIEIKLAKAQQLAS